MARAERRRGELLVAAIDTFDNPAGRLRPNSNPINVRLDIVKESPEWAARVTACTIHLLGTLEWLPDEHDVPDLTRTNPLLAEVASLPGGRLGVIHTDRVVLHDSAGVTAHDFNALMARRLRTPEFPRATEELNAREALAGLSPSDLDTLFSVEGTDTSVALGSRLQTTCPSLHGRVLCVDIDASGVTLMRVDEAGTRTVLFPFTTPARSVSGLPARIAALRG